MKEFVPYRDILTKIAQIQDIAPELPREGRWLKEDPDSLKRAISRERITRERKLTYRQMGIGHLDWDSRHFRDLRKK